MAELISQLCLSILLLAPSILFHHPTSTDRTRHSTSGAAVFFVENPLPCATEHGEKTVITCDYQRDLSKEVRAPACVSLDHARISFDSRARAEVGEMEVEFVITNRGSQRISPPRVVYFAIDGDNGRNYVRRGLQNVNLSNLAPGETKTFSEEMDVGSFRVGHYTIHIWIPDSNPELKFNAAHNLLFANVGVGDSRTGLNTIADFTITVPPPPRRAPRPSN